MINKILYPIDRSEHCKRAFPYVVDMATKFNATVDVLYVYTIPRDIEDRTIIYGVPESYIQNIRTNIKSYSNTLVEDVQKKLQEKGITVETVIKEGKPGPEIAATAEEKQTDLIIMGARGLGAVKSLLLGSVSNYVVHHAKCAQFIVQ